MGSGSSKSKKGQVTPKDGASDDKQQETKKSSPAPEEKKGEVASEHASAAKAKEAEANGSPAVSSAPDTPASPKALPSLRAEPAVDAGDKSAPSNGDGKTSDVVAAGAGDNGDADSDGIYEDDNGEDSGTEDMILNKDDPASSRPYSGVDFKKARPKTASGLDLKLLDKDDYAVMLERYCEYIFSKADVDQDGGLKLEEFTALVTSETLQLTFEEGGVETMFSSHDTVNDGKLIEFDDFVTVMVKLMDMHSDVLRDDDMTSESADWFVMYFDDDPNSLPLYYNTKKKAMTYDKPAVVSYKVEEQDEQDFQMLQSMDGSVTHTSFVDVTGQRWYLDLDNGQWEMFPEEWVDQFQVIEEQDGGNFGFEDIIEDEEDLMDGQLIQFAHAITGQEYEAQLEQGVRMLYDENTGDWIQIPICLEIYVPEVTRALYEMGKDLPNWTNLSEKVLSLRANRYNPQMAVAWKMTEMEFSGEDATTAGAAETAKAKEEAFDPKVVMEEVQAKAEAKTLLTAGLALPSDDAVADGIALRAQLEKVTSLARNLALEVKEKELELTAKTNQCARAEDRLKAGGGGGGGGGGAGGGGVGGGSVADTAAAALKAKEDVARVEAIAAAAKAEHGENSRKAVAAEEDAKRERDRAVKAEQANIAAEEKESTLKADAEASSEAKAQAMAAADGLAAKNKQLEDRIVSLTEQLSAVAGAGGSLETSLAKTEKTLVEEQDKVVSLTSQLAAETSKTGDLAKKIEGLEANAKSLTEKCGALQNSLESGASDQETKREQQHLALRKLQVQINTTKVQNTDLRELVQGTVVQGMLGMMRQATEQLSLKCTVAVEDATRDLVNKYRYEVRQRKLIYNQLQELKGNIRVFCRVRYDNRVKCVLDFPDEKGLGTPTEIVCPNPRDPTERKKFEFDRVFSPASTQQSVFDDTEPIMTSAVDGYNVCILAYGQTGSGKTFTMMGTEDNPGVNRRCVKELINVCAARTSINYTIKVSLMEIYNEKFVDLLSDLPVDQQDCELRMHPKTKAGFVTNVTERPIVTTEDVVKTLADGEVNRSTASTKMNSVSSRSHLLLQLMVEGHDTVSGQVTRGKLTMVDLAGSERISKTEATGQRLVEAAAINKSLSALGQTFTALRQNSGHVPYRNSKLTHILQDSLGGDAKCCVFINVSPAESNLAETLGTINFGSAIRTIELKDGKGGKKKKKKAAASPVKSP